VPCEKGTRHIPVPTRSNFPVLNGRLLVIVLFATVVAGAWFFIGNRQPEFVEIPADIHVDKLTAELFVHDGVGLPAVAEFDVPERYISPILAPFRPVERVEYLEQFDKYPLGRLKLHCRDGRVIEVAWPDSGKNSLCFQVNGKRCVRRGPFNPVAVHEPADDVTSRWTSECTLLTNILWEVHQELVTVQPSGALRGYFEDLERSSGKRPPAIIQPD
jgi:hypothetical protein